MLNDTEVIKKKDVTLSEDDIQFMFGFIRSRFDNPSCSEFEQELIINKCQSMMNLGKWWRDQTTTMLQDYLIHTLNT